MKKFDLEKVKEADLCDFEEVAQAFKKYIVQKPPRWRKAVKKKA